MMVVMGVVQTRSGGVVIEGVTRGFGARRWGRGCGHEAGTVRIVALDHNRVAVGVFVGVAGEGAAVAAICRRVVLTQ